MANRVEGLDRLKAKIAKLSQTARDQMTKANSKNADEFLAKVASIVPRSGDAKGGDLGATLVKEPGETETGFKVAIGGPDAPYPAHLEFGHIGPDGQKVEAVPYWYPAKRVLRKRFEGRRNRALKQAVDDSKAALGGGGERS